MPHQHRVLLVFSSLLSLAVSGCGGDDRDERRLRIVNESSVRITGLKIDGVDQGVELGAGGVGKVPLPEGPGTRTYSIRYTPDGAPGAKEIWSPRTEFEIAEQGDTLLVIHADDVNGEPESNWSTHRFDKLEYSISLPGEPSVRLDGGSVIAGDSGVSYTLICDETRKENLDEFEHGETRNVERNGFDGLERRWTDKAGRRVVDLYLLAHGRLYHLSAMGRDEVELAERSRRFFDSFEILDQ